MLQWLWDNSEHHTLANWETSVCEMFDLSEMPSHSGLTTKVAVNCLVQ